VHLTFNEESFDLTLFATPTTHVLCIQESNEFAKTDPDASS
jgi:hypothetical protein